MLELTCFFSLGHARGPVHILATMVASANVCAQVASVVLAQYMFTFKTRRKTKSIEMPISKPA